MTDTHERTQDRAPERTEHAERSGRGERTSSRRALFGLGAAAAVGTVALEQVLPAVAQASPIRGAAASAIPSKPTAIDSAAAIEHATTGITGKQYATPSKAAAAAGASTSTLFPGYNPKAHLLRRATFGARPSDVADLAKLGIDGWIAKQLAPTSISDPVGDRVAKLFPLSGASASTIRAKIDQFSWDAMFQTAQCSLARQVYSSRQLNEIVVDVFANHLHVPIPGEQWHTSPGFLYNVIRKYALGTFESMLHAAMKHPAMLNYLSNTESRKDNVNENLGRELLELHTVGRTAGYTETMVRSSAAILSGRTWNWQTGSYVYDSTQHVTGTVKVLGFTHTNKTGVGGEAVGDAYITYLAHHPLTAQNIARKLAIRFITDAPSDDLVNRLASVYLKSGTSIKATVQAIFCSSDFWRSVGKRMRRPLEDAVGTLRVLNIGEASGMETPLSWLYWTLDQEGHTPHGWGPPNGYPDVAAAWLSGGAMIQRWNLHRVFVYGWWPKLGYTKPSALVPRTKDMTTGQWVRAVAVRLLGVAPSTHHLVAIMQGAKLTSSSPAPTDDWRCGKVAALILDSPYFQLR